MILSLKLYVRDVVKTGIFDATQFILHHAFRIC